jgi:two-component system, OmpR family, response regulator VicR
MSVLLVDDDRDLVEVVSFAMRRAGLEVVGAHDAPAAIELFESRGPSLVVLDLNLGKWDGLELLREIRRRGGVPVIILSARDAEEDKVRGLELGADDYVTKPFGHRELIARVRAHLRRYGQEVEPPARSGGAPLRVGSLALNPAQHSATKDGRPLSLTVTEFRLLRYLMVNAGTVVPTPTLLKQVWSYDDPTASDVVRVAVYRLRRKLEESPEDPRLLHTVPGVGVMLKAEQG